MLNNFLSNKNFSILLYHSTFEKIPDELFNGLHNVDPLQFKKQIKFLKKYYDFVDLETLFTTDQHKGKIAITFDDAYECIFNTTVPFLLQEKIPSTIFVNCLSLENRVFWRDKIRVLINKSLTDKFLTHFKYKYNNMSIKTFYKDTKNPSVNSKDFDEDIDIFFNNFDFNYNLNNFLINITNLKCFLNANPTSHEYLSFGNHTYSHYVLSSLNFQQQEQEILKNHHILSKLPLRISKIFSIPFGGFQDFNKDTIKILKKLNYNGCLLSRQRLNFKDNNYFLERFMVPKNIKSLKLKIPELYLRSFFQK